ncbi:pyroglutamyl-peptidase [Deinobacterium chartae]|uniref:Pyrrolidone-carboxylate peptidase n=1 Tax=Deinobacterium chartae TaxID=521158 RepID=A0A841HY76_9DEIO|nr:pyroglutamyl-peptidase I [Deinobacterium chartae]MBB6097169.1 pyroglutamyl-peptidase [Deinobacterium chartae]
MRILVTGFDPFGGEPVNPSLEAVRELGRRGLPGSELYVRPLPTSFSRAPQALRAALEELRPDLALCVGQAGGRAELSLERVAVNLADAPIADNDGDQPTDRPLVEGGPNAYFAALPVKAAVAALREAGLPASVSLSAGTFVCNAAMYHLLHLAATDFPGLRGGFLHIPFLPEQAARHPGRPSMGLLEVVRGLELILSVCAAQETDLEVAGGATH